MNLTDLTEVLRDHADVAGEHGDTRLAGVRAKVTTTRRRRAVAGAACVVLAFLGVVYAVAPRHGRLSEPALPVRSFPEYQGGTKLVAQAWAGPGVVVGQPSVVTLTVDGEQDRRARRRWSP